MVRKWVGSGRVWKPTVEIVIPYDPAQKILYERRDPKCVYHDYMWPDHLRRGRGRYGEFPLVVARKFYEESGYTVWASEPKLDSTNGSTR